MKRFFNNRQMLLIAVSAAFLIALATFSLTIGKKNPVYTTSAQVTGEVNKTLNKPTSWLDTLFRPFRELMGTYEENRVLKENLTQHFELQARYTDLENENKHLKELVKVKGDLSAFELVHAAVINRAPDTWFNQLVIAAGSNDGIEVGMLAMSNGGVIGRVWQVTPTTATISLLTNEHDNTISISAVVRTDKTNAYGVISSFDNHKKEFVMTNIALSDEVKVSEQVVTSGLTGVTPGAVPIGEVASVDLDKSGLFKEVRVKPTGELNDIRYVSVVIRGSERVNNE